MFQFPPRFILLFSNAEILSPEQSPNRVTGKILHCLKHDGKLGWLIDPQDRSILILQPNQQPVLCRDNDRLIVLEGIDLQLNIDQIFSFLKMKSE